MFWVVEESRWRDDIAQLAWEHLFILKIKGGRSKKKDLIKHDPGLENVWFHVQMYGYRVCISELSQMVHIYVC